MTSLCIRGLGLGSDNGMEPAETQQEAGCLWCHRHREASLHLCFMESWELTHKVVFFSPTVHPGKEVSTTIWHWEMANVSPESLPLWQPWVSNLRFLPQWGQFQEHFLQQCCPGSHSASIRLDLQVDAQLKTIIYIYVDEFINDLKQHILRVKEESKGFRMRGRLNVLLQKMIDEFHL